MWNHHGKCKAAQQEEQCNNYVENFPRKCAEFAIKSGCPLSIAEGNAFTKFVNELNPTCPRSMSHQAVGEYGAQFYAQLQEKAIYSIVSIFCLTIPILSVASALPLSRRDICGANHRRRNEPIALFLRLCHCTLHRPRLLHTHNLSRGH